MPLIIDFIWAVSSKYKAEIVSYFSTISSLTFWFNKILLPLVRAPTIFNFLLNFGFSNLSSNVSYVEKSISIGSTFINSSKEGFMYLFEIKLYVDRGIAI